MNLTLPHLTVIVEGAEYQNYEENTLVKNFLSFFKSQLDIVFKELYLIEINPENPNLIDPTGKENLYIRLRVVRKKFHKNLSEYLSGDIPLDRLEIDAEGNCDVQLTNELEYRFNQAISNYKNRNEDKK